ncbi:claspin [Spea bombifrons]|uniref:claspin n=1 Tax=Spea bombifrons TaxID=233779 RepID=UPI00234AE6D9|nr:claspin [Spea bombifrons]
MAAECEDQAYLGSEEIIPELKNLESDSDSGQGSCEMASPLELSRSLAEEDSDEEILVKRKPKNKKILEESDSDEGEKSTFAISDEVNGEHEDEIKETVKDLKGKHGRILSIPLDSEDSDKEGLTENVNKPSSDATSPGRDRPVVKQKKNHKSSRTRDGKNSAELVKEKSKRQTGKREKKIAPTGKVKKEKKRKSQVQTENESPPLNDSGCLLADKDLFENEMGVESDLEEESLDAIRTSVKDKLKGDSHHSGDYEGSESDHELEASFEKRKERKAARISKEAMKQLHSETQRLVRASSLSLPYHVPEPKTIHDFFKRRPRPVCQGNAMQLIKSSKYLACKSDEGMDCESIRVQETKVNTGCQLQDPQGLDTNEHCKNVREGDDGGDCESGNASNAPVMSSNSQLCEDLIDQTNTVKEILGKDENVSGVPSLQKENAACEQGLTAEKSSTVSTPRIPKLSKLEKLRALGVDLAVKPRLCADEGSFVNLDEPNPNKELEALKERFLKHTLHKAKPVAERKLNLSIVRKETNAEGKEELKMDIVPVVMAAENLEEKIHGKPGEKLQVLKAKLQEAMKLRRNEERQKRQTLFNLDNEDGFHDEEEAEMTESEDEEEGNEEDVEYLLGDGVEDDDDDANREELEKDVPANVIPPRRPVITESTLMMFENQSTKLGDSLPDKMGSEEAACKDLGKLEEEDYLQGKENSHNSSFELIGSMIPSYQPFSKAARGSLHSTVTGFRSPSPMHFKTSFLSSASKSSGKMSEPSLPVEDSQDLYNASPEPKASYLCAGGGSQFQFSLEDTQSQLLDADGFLNVGHHRSKYSSAKHRLVLDTMDENAMDANMGELLDLCSGQFPDLSQGNVPDPKEEAMEELLGLCSGKFVSQDTSTQNSSSAAKIHKETEKNPMSEAAPPCSGSFPVRFACISMNLHREDSEDEEEEFGDFQLLPCDESDSESEKEDEKDSNSDGENEEDSENDEKEASEEDEEDLLRLQQKKKKLKLKDFMEDEAELSGSDADSGDEEEGEEDEYEEEVIDEDLPSDEELQDQVNKIHMKVTMDEDKRRLRLYQERYLADGDLHSDGPGRTRKYRWKMFDEASQLDMFRRDSEADEQEAENEELDETEARWRKERFEREQWLREQAERGHADQEEDIGEGSQFMKLAKKVTAKVFQRRATVEMKEVKKPVSRNPFEVIKPFSQHKMQTGSLLNKPKEVLQKLAAMSDLNPNAPRNSRNFVFQTVSPGKKESEEKPKSKIRKNISLPTPSPKRFKSDNISSAKSKSRSIFPFLES